VSINPTQFREMVKDVLEYMNPVIPYSKAAEELLMLTAAAESQLGTYIRQVKGPALGVFQMEPATTEDIFDRYLSKRPDLLTRVLSFASPQDEAFDMKYNLGYQTAMCRVFYYRIPKKLPETLPELAGYWKQYYNTHLGKGTVAGALEKYKKYVN